jgi:NAD(P)-dependent dehydrogenase (short-subunit alcohol dehydrogenase family)
MTNNSQDDVDLAGKTIVVTGANAGIGKVAARELARMGATMIMVARSRKRGEKALQEVRAASANDDVHLMLCNLSSQESIREFAAAFESEYERLDVLLNNAGAWYFRRHESVDGLELSFALNHMGYFLLTNLLLDTIKRSPPARIVNVSSETHRSARIAFDDLQRKQNYGMHVYGETKLMNLLFTYELARRLEGTGVTVNAMHPGFVRTNLGRRDNGLLGRFVMPLASLFGRSPERGAETAIYLASSPEVEGVTARYFIDNEEVRSAEISYDEALQARMWEVSERALNQTQ